MNSHARHLHPERVEDQGIGDNVERYVLDDGVMHVVTYALVDCEVIENEWALDKSFAHVEMKVTKGKVMPTYKNMIEKGKNTHDSEKERLTVFWGRGGRPISSMHWLAHSPYEEVEYVIENEHVVIA